MSLWDEKRVARYIKLYGDPRKKVGSQSQLCGDASLLVIGQKVLDVGCGIGHLVPYLNCINEYLGVDSSVKMLEAHEGFFPNGGLFSDGDHETARFPLGGRVVPFDATDLSRIDEMYDTTISISLMLHLERDVAIQVLQQMWKRTGNTMIFSMETCGNSVQRRKSGLIIRNQKAKDVCADLVEHLDVKPEQISYAHQCTTYEMRQKVTPSKRQPLESNPPRMIARTTLFSVSK